MDGSNLYSCLVTWDESQYQLIKPFSPGCCEGGGGGGGGAGVVFSRFRPRGGFPVLLPPLTIVLFSELETLKTRNVRVKNFEAGARG